MFLKSSARDVQSLLIPIFAGFVVKMCSASAFDSIKRIPFSQSIEPQMVVLSIFVELFFESHLHVICIL